MLMEYYLVRCMLTPVLNKWTTTVNLKTVSTFKEMLTIILIDYHFVLEPTDIHKIDTVEG